MTPTFIGRPFCSSNIIAIISESALCGRSLQPGDGVATLTSNPSLMPRTRHASAISPSFSSTLDRAKYENQTSLLSVRSNPRFAEVSTSPGIVGDIWKTPVCMSNSPSVNASMSESPMTCAGISASERFMDIPGSTLTNTVRTCCSISEIARETFSFRDCVTMTASASAAMAFRALPPLIDPTEKETPVFFNA